MTRENNFKNTSGCKGLFRFTKLINVSCCQTGQYVMCMLIMPHVVSMCRAKQQYLYDLLFNVHSLCSTDKLLGLFLIQMVNLNTVSLSPKKILHFTLFERARYTWGWGAFFLFKMLFDHTPQEVLLRLLKNKCTFSVML